MRAAWHWPKALWQRSPEQRRKAQANNKPNPFRLQTTSAQTQSCYRESRQPKTPAAPIALHVRTLQSLACMPPLQYFGPAAPPALTPHISHHLPNRTSGNVSISLCPRAPPPVLSMLPAPQFAPMMFCFIFCARASRSAARLASSAAAAVVEGPEGLGCSVGREGQRAAA